MSTEDVMLKLRKLSRDRDWGQFHTVENLAKSISIEAAELLECFQWGDGADPESIKMELADVLTYCYFLADHMGIDPERTILEKLAITERKYPVEKAYGRSEKYDQL